MAYKKTLLVAASVSALLISTPSFAKVLGLKDGGENGAPLVTDEQVATASDALIEAIKNNHAGNPMYNNLQIDNVEDYDGGITLSDDTDNLTHINISSVVFNASGNAIGNYHATISLEADVTPDCKTYSNAKYTVKGSSFLTDLLLKKDLSSSGTVVFDSLFSSGLAKFCKTQYDVDG